MATLSELCERYFGCTDLYEVLRIPKTADEKQIRKAYHRLSLVVHPDRVEDNKKAEATEKFKVLGKIHSILNDKEKRACYDDIGIVDEDDYLEEDEDWVKYWRKLFKKITIEDINKYEKQYKGSEEEFKDLKTAYVNGKGDFDFILEAVPFTHYEEEPRLRGLLQPLINSGELPAFKAFTDESPIKRERRKRKWQKEAEEAKRIKEEMGVKEDDDLKALIQSRQKDRMENSTSFLDSLAAKYGTKKNSKVKTDPKKRAQKK